MSTSTAKYSENRHRSSSTLLGYSLFPLPFSRSTVFGAVGEEDLRSPYHGSSGGNLWYGSPGTEACSWREWETRDVYPGEGDLEEDRFPLTNESLGSSSDRDYVGWAKTLEL